MPDNWIIAIIK